MIRVLLDVRLLELESQAGARPVHDETVGDHILERLREWDVERVFGYAGDGINGILAAFGRADNEPTFIETVTRKWRRSRRRHRGSSPVVEVSVRLLPGALLGTLPAWIEA